MMRRRGVEVEVEDGEIMEERMSMSGGGMHKSGIQAVISHL